MTTTKTTTHTPGPWMVNQCPDGTVYIDTTLLNICVMSDADDMNLALADARLIAAAPELLEAAEVIMSSITLLNLMNHFPVSTTCKLAKAIAKAKGQQ